jgi:hypothetical protein
MTNYDKIAIFLCDSQNVGGEIYLCNICYYKDNELCKCETPDCIRGIALKLESEVTDDD